MWDNAPRSELHGSAGEFRTNVCRVSAGLVSSMGTLSGVICCHPSITQVAEVHGPDAAPIGILEVVCRRELSRRSYRDMAASNGVWAAARHVAGFMNLAALDRRVGAEGATDGSLSRHASMDCDRCAVRGCFV